MVGGQAEGCPVARRKMAVAHTANPEPDGATRGFWARRVADPGTRHDEILHLLAGAARRRLALSALWRQ